MNKKEVFLAAMKADEFRRRAWVISAFSMIREGPEAWKVNPYPYRIVQTPTGHFFVDPSNENNLSLITDAVAGEAPFSIKEKITISKKDEIANFNGADLETTYGRVLFNYTAVVWPFKNKIPYINDRVSPREMEDLIIDRLKDNPEKQEDRNDSDIYVDEYLDFCDAMFYLAGFAQLCVPAATRKTMTVSPEIAKRKAQLLEENKDRLHDPAVVAKISAELVAMDRAWLKDDPGADFLINNKSYNVVRSKLFLMHGAEVGLDEGIDVDLIKNSLSEGWDINKFPAMNNSLRAGSFNRGAQTMLGGESVKWLLRASSNINISADDCGSKLGNDHDVDGDNYKRFIGFSAIVGNGTVKIDEETAKSFIGKKITVRTPQFCLLEKTDYCKCCVGDRLSQNPTAASSAISEYGSAFLSMFMAAAHGKALTLAKMDYKKALI